MRTGATISGAVHLGLIAFAIFGVEWLRSADVQPLTVTEIEFVEGSEFEAALSSAPFVPSESPDQPRPPATADAPGNVETPKDTTASAEVVALAGVVSPEPKPEPPEIGFRNPVNVPTEAPAPSIAEIPSPDPLDREALQPESPPSTEPVAPMASVTAPTPGAKPTPPPEPEPEPEKPEETAAATAPDPEAEAAPTPDPEPVEETSPESVAEVQPDAPEGPAPQEARLPVAKPADLAAAARAARSTEVAAAETAKPEETRPTPTAAAAEERTAASGGTTPRRGPPLNNREVNALRVGIKKYYTYNGDRSDPAMQVTLRLELDQAGEIMGKPQVTGGQGGNDSSRRALGQAASRALIRAARAGEFKRLPTDKYDRWKLLNFIFTLDKLSEVTG